MVESAYMERAIKLALLGIGWTNPNPLVGAVIVKDGKVIGEGYHERFGGLHAERQALASCHEPTQGATMYVTLEPCDHTGHQPPCTEAIIRAGITQLVVGSRDPNPKVSGRGVKRLREAGIEVIEDVLREACDAINPVFFHYIQTNRPYVVDKWAMTADGRICSQIGDSRWVSNELSRADVHEMRHQLASILVGIGTVLADDPLLTCRRRHEQQGHNPARVVCDSHLQIPESCQLIQTAEEAPLIIATTEQADEAKMAVLEGEGAQVVVLPQLGDHLSMAALMEYLGAHEIDSVLVEGGPAIHGALLQAGLVNQLTIYLAPKIIGGEGARGPVAGRGIELMAEALELDCPRIERLGGDVRLDYSYGGSALLPLVETFEFTGLEGGRS